jgi:sporulation protein YlmC with PRC-barrel domain
MRLRDLHGLPVIDPSAARKLGTVVDYEVDPSSARLAALKVSGTQPETSQRIPAQHIRRVGRHAVILTAQAATDVSSPPNAKEHWLDQASLEGLEVIGDDGNRVGYVSDAVFDQDTLALGAYLLRLSAFSLNRFTGRRGRIEPDTVQACSPELMIVSGPRPRRLGTIAEEHAVDGRPTLPLKTADRLPAPDFEAVGDGQAAPTRRA